MKATTQLTDSFNLRFKSILLGLIFLFPFSTLAAPHIVFNNFDQQITLIDKGEYYQIQNSEDKVKLSNRIIIKVRQQFNAIQLQQSNPQVSKVSPLYLGNNYNYYLLTLSHQSSLLNTMKILKTTKDIILVQPDILQLTDDPITRLKKLQSKNINKNFKNIKKNRKNREKSKINKAVHNDYLSSLPIKQLWKTSKGKGVNIAIIDDGVDLLHPDLLHIDSRFSYDVQTHAFTAKPLTLSESHGTKIAGIIFSAHNNIGIDGIAPDASLIAIRQPDTWTSNTLLSFQVAKLAEADIINCSWTSPWLLQPVAEVISELSQHGRKEKGTVIIIAAGNNAKEILPNSTEAAIDSAIVVGANNKETASRLKTSNFGNSVDIFIDGNNVNTTVRSSAYGSFAATSLSAAIASGLSALLLSQDPNLTATQLLNKLIHITSQ